MSARIKTFFTDQGVKYFFEEIKMPKNLNEAFELATKIPSMYEQSYNCMLELIENDLCDIVADGFLIKWKSVYSILQNSDFLFLESFLDLPKIVQILPSLNCRMSLSDSNFQVYIDNFIWQEKSIQSSKVEGPVVIFNKKKVLMPETCWKLVQLLSSQKGKNTQYENELFWGKARIASTLANAVYTSKYLKNTYVITPENLKLKIKKTNALGERVVTLEPTFDGAPNNWIERYDKMAEIKEHYDFSAEGENCRVVFSDSIQKVLKVIKTEMPSRKIAGNKAEAFLHNPYALLGDDVHSIIHEDDFIKAKEDAGIFESYFEIRPMFKDKKITCINIVISAIMNEKDVMDANEYLDDVKSFKDFVMKFKKACENNQLLFCWKDYDFQVDSNSKEKLQRALQFLYEWSSQDQEVIQVKDIYDLTFFGPRIEGIGIAPCIKIPYISQGEEKNNREWMPDFIESSIRVGEKLIPLKEDWLKDFEKKILKAESENKNEIFDSVLPAPVNLDEAKQIVKEFKKIQEAAFPSNEILKQKKDISKKKKETLILKHNFDSTEYLEERKKNLLFEFDANTKMKTTSMKNTTTLIDHQEFGVQWLLNLYLKSPDHCRGALIADDMGLGKTIQILMLLALAYEKGETKPSIIVAPVALLDNWIAESKKFFTESFPKMLCLYGDNLKKAKQPKEFIEKALLEEKGITNLLRTNWVGDSKIILTTYETLRDYEFSLAREHFSIMICDEAQRIKTPNAMVTLAAKKMHVQFRVACTGTPVENSLVDLWCLFDFIQPGLLGALSIFSKRYRRPIEAKTEEQRASIEELREIINPQILRRMKSDISKDLPEKIFVKNNPQKDLLEIHISDYQRKLYSDRIFKYGEISHEKDAKKRARLSFGVFHDLRAICAEPYCLPKTRFACDSNGVKSHFKNSPKISWLCEILETIAKKNEKVILFTEIREIQESLRFFIKEKFRFLPNVINGDSNSRQSIVDRFQDEEGFSALILSPLAAGFGLNIVKANHVIHFTRTWNPAKEAQATDRAYRIGSKKDVYVYCPTIVDHRFATFEVILDQLMKSKSALASDMLNGAGGDFSIHEFTPENINGEKIQDRRIDINEVDLFKPDLFEMFCAYIWKKKGYSSHVTTKKSGDGGIDVVAINNTEHKGMLIQCKTTSTDKPLAWDAVKDVVTGEAQYVKHYPGIFFERIIITNKSFNKNAKEHALANKVIVLERQFIELFLSEYTVMKSEIDNLAMECNY